jgi:hypothetical protein
VAAGHVDEETGAPLLGMRRQPGEIHFRDALYGFAGVTEFDRDSYPVTPAKRAPRAVLPGCSSPRDSARHGGIAWTPSLFRR